MNRIEDRLRDYYAVRAQTIEADTIRHGVRVPPDRSHQRLGVLRRRSAFAPLAAAAAVAVVAVAAAMFGSAVHPELSPAGAVSALPPGGQPVARLVSYGAIPPRFITLTANGDPHSVPSYAVVRSTATGARLAMIQPSVPHGTIVAVSGAADDRTFVLAEQKLPLAPAASMSLDHGSLFLLHLRSDGTRDTLTRLPIIPGNGANAMALSADGTKLAMAVRLETGSELRVYNLSSGAVQTWAGNRSGIIGDGMAGPDDAASISWAADGRHLLFSWIQGPNMSERLLDTSLGGSSLAADSRLVLTIPGHVNQPLFCQGDVVITPDGSALICPGLTAKGSAGEGDGTIFFREYSTATGKVIRQLATWTYGHTDWFLLGALWTNPSGTVIIGVIPKSSQNQNISSTATPDPNVTPTPPPGTSPRIGVVFGQTFTPLDLPPGVTSGVW